MYLIDTNVISEARKGARANVGVRRFFADVGKARADLFLSVITLGELRRGVGLIRHHGDLRQARQLERWLAHIVDDFTDHIIAVDEDVAQVWGRLCVPHPENGLDKLIAATALIHQLTVVTRNRRHFEGTGTKIFNPFKA